MTDERHPELTEDEQAADDFEWVKNALAGEDGSWVLPRGSVIAKFDEVVAALNTAPAPVADRWPPSPTAPA